MTQICLELTGMRMTELAMKNCAIMQTVKNVAKRRSDSKFCFLPFGKLGHKLTTTTTTQQDNYSMIHDKR